MGVKLKNDPRKDKVFCPSCGRKLAVNLIPAFREKSWKCKNCKWEVIERYPFPRVSEDITSCYNYPWEVVNCGKLGWTCPDDE
jgi:transposase-like protein